MQRVRASSVSSAGVWSDIAAKYVIDFSISSAVSIQQNKRRNSSLENAVLGNAQSNISQSVPSTSIIGLKESTLIDFILRRHPQEILVDRLKREYIRTSHDMTVENLKVFLGKKLGYCQYPHFQVRLCHYVMIFWIAIPFSRILKLSLIAIIMQILTTAGERTVALPDNVTLSLIRRDICDNPDSEIILYYRVFPQCWIVVITMLCCFVGWQWCYRNVRSCLV